MRLGSIYPWTGLDDVLAYPGLWLGRGIYVHAARQVCWALMEAVVAVEFCAETVAARAKATSVVKKRILKGNSWCCEELKHVLRIVRRERVGVERV